MKAGSDEFETTQRRQSDAYVFCVLSANDQKTTEQLEIVRRAAPTRSVFINTSLAWIPTEPFGPNIRVSAVA